MISILIATIGRFKKISDCLKSLEDNSFQDFEILLIDQNKNNKLKRLVQQKNSPKIRYFYITKKNKSKAINFGLRKAKGKIVAFTDDDCLPDKEWLKNISSSFEKNKEVIGVFGRSLPFKENKNKGLICPCLFLNNKKIIISKLCFHSKKIGFGNNMAFRKEIFDKIGNFKYWLGPGSIGSNAEDAEFSLRVLLKKYKILFNQDIVVYHNRWLTKEQFRKQCLSYSCGEVACYSYFSFQGCKFTKKVVIKNFKDSYWEIRKAIKSILIPKPGLNKIQARLEAFKMLIYAFEKLFYRLRGLIVGWYYAKKEPY